jgi:CO/xanthine dehydrogenase FAD-binding subunit
MDLHTVTAIVPASAGRSASPSESGSGWGPGTAGHAWLAGGTWLFSQPQPELHTLHDLTALGWPPLTVTDTGLEIAATCTFAELVAFAPPPSWSAAGLFLQAAQALLGSFKIWNAATVGGNLCLALPAGPMTSLATALDAQCLVLAADGSEREVPALDFVIGPSRTVLRPGELLRSVAIPLRALRSVTAFRQFSLNTLGRSAAVVIGRIDQETDALLITVTAATTRPVRVRLPRQATAADLTAALARAPLTYHDDVHGDPSWRAQLTRVLAEEVRCELAGGRG